MGGIMRTLKYNITYDVIYPSSDSNNEHYGLGAGMISNLYIVLIMLLLVIVPVML